MTPGYMLKLDRARHHFNELRDESAKWFTRERYPLVDEPDPDGSYQRRQRITKVTPIPGNPFSLLIGDILYSLRSCLDNLAYDLNRKNNPYIGSKSMFPVYFDKITKSGAIEDGRAKFATKRADRIGSMDAGAQTVIEQLQPYNRGSAFQGSPLWAIDELGNIDKHRTIHLVAVNMHAMLFLPDKSRNVANICPLQVPEVRLETNTVIVRYTPIPQDPNLDVSVYFLPAFGLGFSDGPYKDICALNLLETLIVYVADHITKPLEPFL